MSDPKPKIKSTSKIKEVLHDKNIVSAVGMHQMNLDAKQRVEGYLKFCEERVKAKKAKDNAQGPAAASAVANQALPSLGDFNFTDLREFIAEVTAQPCDAKEHFEVYDNDRKQLSKILAAAIERLNGDRVLDLIAMKVPLDEALSRGMLGAGNLGTVFFTAINYTLVCVTEQFGTISRYLESSSRDVSAHKVSAYNLSRASFIIIDLINANARIDLSFDNSNNFIHRLVIAASQTLELLPLLRFVLEKNCDINALDDRSKTPLFRVLNLLRKHNIARYGVYYNPLAIKEVIKLFVLTGKQQYHFQRTPISNRLLNLVDELFVTLRDTHPDGCQDIFESLNLVLEDVRKQALVHCASLKDSKYRCLESELKTYSETQLLKTLRPLDEGEHRFRKEFIDTKIIPPAVRSAGESEAEGFTLARIKINSIDNQYLQPECWVIVKEYLNAAFLDRGYELGLHLSLPEAIKTHQFVRIVSSAWVVATPMTAVQSMIESNDAFERNASNVGVGHRKAHETVVSAWTVSAANCFTEDNNSVSFLIRVSGIHYLHQLYINVFKFAIGLIDIKGKNEDRTVKKQENVLCYRYRKVNPSLGNYMANTDANDNAVTTFTLQPSQSAANTHTVIRHFRDERPSPAFLYLYKGRLAVALKKEYSSAVPAFFTGDRQPFCP